MAEVGAAELDATYVEDTIGTGLLVGLTGLGIGVVGTIDVVQLYHELDD